MLVYQRVLLNNPDLCPILRFILRSAAPSVTVDEETEKQLPNPPGGTGKYHRIILNPQCPLDSHGSIQKEKCRLRDFKEISWDFIEALSFNPQILDANQNWPRATWDFRSARRRQCTHARTVPPSIWSLVVFVAAKHLGLEDYKVQKNTSRCR